ADRDGRVRSAYADRGRGGFFRRHDLSEGDLDRGTSVPSHGGFARKCLAGDCRLDQARRHRWPSAKLCRPQTPPRTMKLSGRMAHAAAIYLATAILTVAGWWLCVRLTGVEAYLLPDPVAVLSNMWVERASLLHEAGVTAWETVLGFIVSVAIAIPV